MRWLEALATVSALKVLPKVKTMPVDAINSYKLMRKCARAQPCTHTLQQSHRIKALVFARAWFDVQCALRLWHLITNRRRLTEDDGEFSIWDKIYSASYLAMCFLTIIAASLAGVVGERCCDTSATVSLHRGEC
eukprot:SAG11_NODE_2255_length_3620_cov_1.538483_6_plen_134_part_00